MNVRLNASYSHWVYNDHKRNWQLAFQAHSRHSRHSRFEWEWRKAEMKNHKNSWHETDEKEIRIQDALKRYMIAQKQIRNCTETATKIQEKRSSSAWMQTEQINLCKQKSMIVDYFIHKEDIHVLNSIYSDKFSNFYSVSTTFLSRLISL